MAQASIKYLRTHINVKHPEARVQVWQSMQTQTWYIEVRFNATTAVLVTGINYEDLCEDFLDDDLTPAILDQREGGQYHEMTYKQAKELTKALQS